MTELYFPRMRAELIVPSNGKASAINSDEDDPSATVAIPVRVRSATWEVNDHLAADTLELVCEWNDAGIDPRLLASAVVSFWLGEVDGPTDALVPTKDNHRFVGVLTNVERDMSATGRSVVLQARDYTELFIATKYFADIGVPKYSQTIREAWTTICEFTGYYDVESEAKNKITTSVEALVDQLVGEPPELLDTPLGKSLPDRLSKLGKFQPKKDATAWDVWQQVVGSVGLISFVRRDEVVVTDSTAYYALGPKPARFIWGKNILTMKEKRHSKLRNKRLALTSRDPLTHSVIEAFWPPRDTATQRHKKGKAKKAIAGGLAELSDYDFFEYNYGAVSKETLEKIAKNAWEEMSRCELEGTFTTREMMVDAEGTSERLDVLGLQAGDVIRVEFAENEKSVVRALGDDEARFRYLMSVGYSEDTARVMVEHLSDFGDEPPEFVVRKVHTVLQHDRDAGSFEVTVDYANRVQPIVEPPV